jgi:hypothetical protein
MGVKKSMTPIKHLDYLESRLSERYLAVGFVIVALIDLFYEPNVAGHARLAFQITVPILLSAFIRFIALDCYQLGRARKD